MGTTQTLSDAVNVKVCSEYLLMPVVIKVSWNAAVLTSS